MSIVGNQEGKAFQEKKIMEDNSYGDHRMK